MNGFNNTGAVSGYTPNPNALNPFNLSGVTSPKSSALNAAQSPNFTTMTGQNTYVPPPPTNPTPTGPVSKMKVTHPSGTVVETTHDTSQPTPGLYNPNAKMQTEGLNAPSQGGVSQAKTTLNDIPTGPNYNLGQNPVMQPNNTTGTNTGNGLIGAIGNAEQTTTSTPPSDVTSTSNTTGTTFPGLLSGITSAGAKTEAEQRATADKIAQLKQNLQTDTGLIMGQPQELNFQTGRINALQTQEAAKEAALQGELQAEIGAGTQRIGAETAAAGLAQPSPAGYGQTVFNPITGQYSGGSSGVSSSDPFYATMETYAQQLANNQPTSIPSSVSGNPVLQAQLIQMAKAINPNFNYNTSQGIGAGQAQAGGNTVQYAQAIGKVTPVAQNLDNLIQTNNINPTNLTYANGAINWLKANLGTPAQQAAITEFNGQLNDIASTLAPALGIPGGATTDFKTSLGQSIVNGLQNGQSVQQSIQYFIQQAGAGALGAAGGAANPIGTLNQTTSSGLFNW